MKSSAEAMELSMPPDIESSLGHKNTWAERTPSDEHRFIPRLVILAVITSIIAITTAALWLAHRTSSVEKWVGATIPLQAPVTCCDLIQNPDRYYSKTLRVRAILLGYHELALYDPACKGVDKYILADFDSASRQKLIKGIADLKGAGSREGNFWTEVVLVGRFEKVKDTDVKSDARSRDHQYIKYRFQLVVMDVEQIGALPPNMTWPPE